ASASYCFFASAPARTVNTSRSKMTANARTEQKASGHATAPICSNHSGSHPDSASGDIRHLLERKRIDNLAPCRVFRNARLALAEEADDQFVIGVEHLNRGDDAINRRLAADEAAGNRLLVEVQVELGIEHIVPLTHLDQLLDRAGMDLDAALVANEHHDLAVAIAGKLKHPAGGAVLKLECEVITDAAERLHAADLVFAEHYEEVVDVLEVFPGGTESFPVNFCIRAVRSFCCRFFNFKSRVLFSIAILCNQIIIGGLIRMVGQVNLVDGGSGRIEELQALARALLGRGLLGESVLPMAHEQPQIDVGIVQDAGADRPVGKEARIVVNALALVHAGIIPGQRENLTERFKIFQDALGIIGKADHIAADAGGEKLTFR